MLPVVTRWHAGTAGFQDFWLQHSEHRVVALKAAIWAIGGLTDFNVVSVHVRRLRAGGDHIRPPLPISLRLGLQEHEPRLIAPLLTTSFVPGVLPGPARKLVLEHSLAAVVPDQSVHSRDGLGVGSMAQSLAKRRRWPPDAPSSECSRRSRVSSCGSREQRPSRCSPTARRQRMQWLSVWALAACSTVAAYLWGLHWAQRRSPSRPSIQAVLIQFASACLGLPVASWASPELAALAGWSGCAALCICELVPVPAQPPADSQTPSPAAPGGARRPGVAADCRRTRWWRSAIRPDEPLRVRADVVLGRRRDRDSDRVFACAVSFSRDLHVRSFSRPLLQRQSFLAGGYARANVDGYRQAYTRSRNLQMAVAAVSSANPPPREVLRFLYPPDEDRAQRLLNDLQAFGLGPFSSRSKSAFKDIAREFTATPGIGGVDGFLDGGDCQGTTGWAWDPAHPDLPVALDVWAGGTRLGTVTANWFRWDLLAAGKGNGQHAFRFVFPTQTELQTGRAVNVTFAGSDRPLRGSPRTVPCRD